jgi:hypothetical protein
MRGSVVRPEEVCVEIVLHNDTPPNLLLLIKKLPRPERKYVLYTTADQVVTQIIDTAIGSQAYPFRPFRHADAIITPDVTWGHNVTQLPQVGNIGRMAHYRVCVRAAHPGEAWREPDLITCRMQLWPNARRLANKDVSKTKK